MYCIRVVSDKVLVLLQRMALCITRKYVSRLIGQRLCLQLMRAAPCGVQINDLRARQRPFHPVTLLAHGGCFAFYFMHSDKNLSTEYICSQQKSDFS